MPGFESLTVKAIDRIDEQREFSPNMVYLHLAAEAAALGIYIPLGDGQRLRQVVKPGQDFLVRIPDTFQSYQIEVRSERTGGLIKSIPMLRNVFTQNTEPCNENVLPDPEVQVDNSELRTYPVYLPIQPGETRPFVPLEFVRQKFPQAQAAEVSVVWTIPQLPESANKSTIRYILSETMKGQRCHIQYTQDGLTHLFDCLVVLDEPKQPVAQQ